MGYAGGKGRLWKSIVALMPPHDVYIETHLGGGAVLKNKRPAARSIGIDIDPVPIAAATGWKIPNLALHLGDAVEFLADYALGGQELIYADPPYLAETKRWRRYYRHEYSNDDHVELLAMLTTFSCPVMISGYPHPIYQEALAGWNYKDLVNVTRAGCRTERLWANFEFSDDLHDYDPIGANFRERERVRRKTARWMQRLAAMPEIERRAILAALIRTTEVEPNFITRLVRQRTETAHERILASVAGADASN